MARGLALEYAGTEFNGEARIEASGKQSAVGVWAGTRTLVDFNDHAVIKTTATGGEEYEGDSRAVFVENGDPDGEATVRFYNGAEIVSDGYAFYGDGKGTSANIYLWSHEDTVTNIVGDVYMTQKAMADMNLSEGGTFTGATSGDGLIYVKLDKRRSLERDGGKQRHFAYLDRTKRRQECPSFLRVCRCHPECEGSLDDWVGHDGCGDEQAACNR